MKTKILFFFAALTSLIACNPQPEIDNETMLDGNKLFDLSLYHPENYLVSEYIAQPTEQQKNMPVIIAAHGYSATTFEWDELRTFADSAKTFYVSQVLLGGHGRTYGEFKAATWEVWQSSIVDEYTKLSIKGFRKIYLAGSSTGCPLIINMVKTGYFENYTKPKGIFLIDPIVIPSNKQLTMVSLLGPVLGFSPTNIAPGEVGKWYAFRPQESLKQLMELIDITRKDLQKGITLPENTFLKVFKCTEDDNADPVGAVLIYKGMKTSNGGNINIEMVNSNIHVFTRLKGRDGVKASDVALQYKAFKDMESKMKE
jgi:carboxylesterase